MKGFAFVIALAVTLFASSAFAGGFGAVNVAVNGRGFNSVAVAAGGASVTSVNSFGRRNTTVVNNGLGTTVVQQRNGGVFPIFGRRNQTTVINNGAAFAPLGVNVLSVNGRQLNAFNAFGTTAFTDAAGNVFEADAFGNTVFRGNAFNRGFGVNGFSTFNSGVFLQSGGFVPAGGFAVRSFGCP